MKSCEHIHKSSLFEVDFLLGFIYKPKQILTWNLKHGDAAAGLVFPAVERNTLREHDGELCFKKSLW